MGEKHQTDLDRIGLFEEMSYLVGTYAPSPPEFNKEARKGKQMMTNCTKIKSARQDGYFDKVFARIFEGEGYSDPLRLRRRFRLEESQKNRPEIFKPVSSSKDMCGFGTYYGTFQEYMKDKMPAFSPLSRPFVKVACPGKNMLVQPPQKGTGYGYPNVTISKLPPYFLEEEYERLREVSKESKGKYEPGEKKAAFILGTREEEYFDKNPFETERGPQYVVLSKPEHFNVPFVPPSPGKKDGGMKAGCFDKFPEFMSGAFSVAPSGYKNVVNSSGKTFTPWHGVRIYPVRSVVDKNVMMRVNNNNLSTLKGVVYCSK